MSGGSAMRFGVNLRGDLAKLSDQELGERIDHTWAERQARWRSLDILNRFAYGARFIIPFGRGPLHARVFYRTISLAHGFGGLSRDAAAVYLLDCEIKDLMDELKQRVRDHKKRAEVTQ